MAQLFVRLVPTEVIYTDDGTDADMSVAIYQPTVPDGWYWLGHVAVRLWEGLSKSDSGVGYVAPYAALVQPACADAGLICPMTDSPTLLWDDEHSHGKQDIQIFQPVPSESTGFAAMGLFAFVDHGYSTDNNPATDSSTKQLWSQLAAINVDLLCALTDGSDFVQVWSDSGSGANGNGKWKDISYWRSASQVGFTPGNQFFASESSDIDPSSVAPTPYIFAPGVLF